MPPQVRAGQHASLAPTPRGANQTLFEPGVSACDVEPESKFAPGETPSAATKRHSLASFVSPPWFESRPFAKSLVPSTGAFPGSALVISINTWSPSWSDASNSNGRTPSKSESTKTFLGADGTTGFALTRTAATAVSDRRSSAEA
jgi:hypothetical protein